MARGAAAGPGCGATGQRARAAASSRAPRACSARRAPGSLTAAAPAEEVGGLGRRGGARGHARAGLRASLGPSATWAGGVPRPGAVRAVRAPRPPPHLCLGDLVRRLPPRSATKFHVAAGTVAYIPISQREELHKSPRDISGHPGTPGQDSGLPWPRGADVPQTSIPKRPPAGPPREAWNVKAPVLLMTLQ